jgi:hypothetical protein
VEKTKSDPQKERRNGRDAMRAESQEEREETRRNEGCRAWMVEGTRQKTKTKKQQNNNNRDEPREREKTPTCCLLAISSRCLVACTSMCILFSAVMVVSRLFLALSSFCKAIEKNKKRKYTHTETQKHASNKQTNKHKQHTADAEHDMRMCVHSSSDSAPRQTYETEASAEYGTLISLQMSCTMVSDCEALRLISSMCSKRFCTCHRKKKKRRSKEWHQREPERVQVW